MLSIRHLITALLMALYATTTHAADCSQPDSPSIPDGSEASTEEMISAQQQVKGFVADGRAYLDCIKQAELALGEEATEEQKQQLLASYNSMVDQMQSTSDAFNAAIRDYKANQ